MPSPLVPGLVAAAIVVAAAPAITTPPPTMPTPIPAACTGETLPALPPAPAGTSGPSTHRRPMWLWDTPKVLLDAKARAELFAFCACQGIDTVWMQVALERERAAGGTPVLQHAD